MTTHTDRIGQILEQSGVGFVSEEFPDIWQLHMHAGRDELLRFAQLVAEDFNEAYTEAVRNSPHVSAADFIRARYSLKGE